MQTQNRHPYDYNILDQSRTSGWRKNGKRLSQDWVFVWAVQHPQTGRVHLVMSDCPSGAPTRLEPIETWHNRDRLRQLDGTDDRVPDPPTDGEKWRLLASLIDSGQIKMTEKNYGVIDSARLNVLMEQLTDD